MQNIAQPQDAEEALRESEARYRALSKALTDLVFVQSRDGTFLEYHGNPDALYVPPGQFLGKGVREVFPAQFAATILALIDKAIISGEIQTLEYSIPVAGQPRHYEGRIVPYDHDKILSIIRDITDHKRTEEALRDSETRMTSIFRAAPIGIGLVSNRVLLEANARLCRMTGYSRAELIGQSARLLYPTQEEFDYVGQVKYKQIAEVGTGTVETRFRRKDGTIIDVLLSSTPLDPSNLPAGVTFTALDITDRKRAEEEKVRLESQLRQAQKMESVGRLAGGVAHDFNNMLGVIIGHAELALRQIDPKGPLYADLQAIRQAGHRSADLTRQLLAFARKQVVTPKVLDLNDTIAGTLKMLRRLIGEDIDLVWMPGAALWLVTMDPSQIDQVLANLCVNSRDAIAGVGTISIETENVICDEAFCADYVGFEPGAYVQVTVSDDGCGMSQEAMEHLFEPFFTTKEVGQGTGLGLPTVWGIVRQNRGFVIVNSELGLGTTVKIYVPRTVGQTETVEAPQPSVQGGPESVLLVEDEAAILSLTKTVLEQLGYSVLTARTPGDALRQAADCAAQIELLITDVVMPEMNGRELATRIQAMNPKLRCLFVSGYTANVIAHQGMLEKGVWFLQKPFSIDDLAAKVREVLDHDRA